MSVTKLDLAEELTKNLSIQLSHARELVDEFFEVFKNCLEAGEAVHLSGFGNFDLRDKVARPGRNPKTGEEVVIEARRVVTFKAGQKLRTLLQD